MISPAPAVYIAAIEDDLVALDLENDGYFCLPGLGRRLIEDGEGRWTATGAAVESALLETGLFHVEPPRARLSCRRPSAWLIASQTPEWLFGGEGPVSLSWAAIARVLRDPVVLSVADLLDDWKTFAPGALHLPDGRNRTLWSPARAARGSAPISAADLRETVDATVASLTRGRSALLVEVSGGLDSAIMATSLHAGNYDGRVIWLNIHGP